MTKARDSVKNTFLTTALLCVICSVFVSASAVGLRSRQDLNKQLDKKKNILSVCEIDSSNGDVQRLFEDNIEARLVDLQTGSYVEQTPDSKQTASSFDFSKLAESESQTSFVSPPDRDDDFSDESDPEEEKPESNALKDFTFIPGA